MAVYRAWQRGFGPRLLNIVLERFGNVFPAVVYHFCLSLPAAFTQPGQSLLAEPCTLLVIWLFDKVKKPQVVNMRIYKSGDRRTRHFGSGARIKPVLNKGPFIKDVP